MVDLRDERRAGRRPISEDRKMMDMKLLHVNWAMADNGERRACDQFLLDVFGAQTVHEMLMSKEREGVGYGREESLLVVSDTMLIPISPTPNPKAGDESIAGMLKFHAREGMWIGIALQVKDLAEAGRWTESLGLKGLYRAPWEHIYFVLDRNETLGMRFEFICIDLDGDPRIEPDFDQNWWRDHHPLGIERLQSIGVSVDSLDRARSVLSGKFGFKEVTRREMPGEAATCAGFMVGTAFVEAMQATDPASALAAHARDIQGIYCLTYKVKSLGAAADYLRSKGFSLVGEAGRRLMIDPAQAYGRRIYFSEDNIAGDPRLAA
jgi:hypothetical protein